MRVNDQDRDPAPQEPQDSLSLKPLPENQIPSFETKPKEVYIEEAQISSADDLDSQRSLKGSQILPFVGLFIIIIVLFAILLLINGGGSAPVLPPTSVRHCRSKLPDVIVVPAHKLNHQPKPIPGIPGLPDLPKLPNFYKHHAPGPAPDPLLNRAATILNAESHSTFYSNHPAALAAYLSRHLNYPVKPQLVFSKNTLGLEINNLTGNVILAHIPKKSNYPKIAQIIFGVPRGTPHCVPNSP